MADPLADPRTADLLGARPDEVRAIAAQLRGAAEGSGQIAGGLSAARDDTTWTGRAAEGFRGAIGRLPVKLERIHGGFRAVAAALSVYESELWRIRSPFMRVVAELEDAEVRMGRGVPAESAALRRRAFALLDEFESAREACRAEIGIQLRQAPVGRARR